MSSKRRFDSEALRRLRIIGEHLEAGSEAFAGLDLPDGEEGDSPREQGIIKSFSCVGGPMEKWNCGPLDKEDEIDEALAKLAVDVSDFTEGSPESCSDKVYNILSGLADEELIEELPSPEEDTHCKANWLANAVPKIREKLVKMELLPPDGAVGDTPQ